MGRALAWIGLVAIGLAWTAAAGAQSACPRCTIVGDAPDALPGISDVPIATLRPALSGSIALAGGWGYVSGEPWEGSQRHRISGAISGSIHPVEWLAIGLRMQGRWETVDRGGGNPSDNGLVGHPTLTLRASMEPVAGLGLGLDTAVWMYGGEAPSLEPGSTSLRVRAMASYLARGDSASVTLAASVGGILDNSRAAAPRSVTDRLSDEDRLSLGVSDYSGVLVGLGAVARIVEVIELMGEASWRIHVGDGAPDVAGWPLHVVLGARYRPLGEILEIGAYVDLRIFEARLDYVAPMRNVVPIDPLLSLMLQATIRLGVDDARPVDDGAERDPEDDGAGEVVAPARTTGSVSGRVVDESGAAVAGASIEVTPAAPGAQAITATSDAEGRFAVAEVPIGSAQLVVRRDGAAPVERTIEVAAGADVEVPIALAGTIPQGEIRGVVQSYDGRPLAGARVRIMPIGSELTTDADGAFEAPVPPGSYEVTLEAPGHRPQTRRVEVQERGVVVLNAQLQRAR